MFNSRANEHEATCLSGTHIELLSQIDRWAKQQDGEHILWLRGMAGTGKSTISRTVTGNFAVRGHLGASFFRRDGDRGKATWLFTTIAVQLVRLLPALAQHVRNAIEVDQNTADWSIKDRFEKLILRPLKQVQSNLEDHPKTVIVVIDGLDERDNENGVKLIISLLSSTRSLRTLCLSFFLLPAGQRL